MLLAIGKKTMNLKCECLFRKIDNFLIRSWVMLDMETKRNETRMSWIDKLYIFLELVSVNGSFRGARYASRTEKKKSFGVFLFCCDNELILTTFKTGQIRKNSFIIIMKRIILTDILVRHFLRSWRSFFVFPFAKISSSFLFETCNINGYSRASFPTFLTKFPPFSIRTNTTFKTYETYNN